MGSLGWDPPAPAPRGAQHHPPVLSMAELRLQHGVGTAAAGRLQRWGECAAASHSTWAWPWVLRLTCKKIGHTWLRLAVEIRISLNLGGERKAAGTLWVLDLSMEDVWQGGRALRVSTACLRGCILLEKASARS